MSAVAHLTIHESQFPAKVRRELFESLRSRKINHKFHYDSIKQTQKWLALHQAYAPSRNDADCTRIYDEAFEAAVAQVNGRRLHLLGLGCGGGQKDSHLLKLLENLGKEVFYSPVDVSSAMVLTARQEAIKVVPEEKCFPVVCDLADASDFREIFAAGVKRPMVRIVTFFGMLPNFEPETILPKLGSLLSPGDILLASANLAPGPDYAAGVRKVLPQYDNPLTREWLMTLLLDVGVEASDGELSFTIEDFEGLKRIAAVFQFRRSRSIQIDSERFVFEAGETVRLFFSFRHTPELLSRLLAEHGLHASSQWITKSEEEGVFLIKP